MQIKGCRQELDSTCPHIGLELGAYRPKALQDLEAPDPAYSGPGDTGTSHRGLELQAQGTKSWAVHAEGNEAQPTHSKPTSRAHLTPGNERMGVPGCVQRAATQKQIEVRTA